jgi:hypothetical protein
MTRRITFTPTKAQVHLIEGYRKAYKLDKPQDVLSAGLAQLEKAEKVRAYNQLAVQMRADASPGQEAAEAHNELVPSGEGEPETETWPPRSPLPSGHDGGAE